MSKKQNIIKVGQVFPVKGGTVTVIKYENSRKILVKHDDSVGREAFVSAVNLRAGEVMNPYRPTAHGVGFFGVGPYKAGRGSSMAPEYRSWRKMMDRVYSEECLQAFPTYTQCSVHPSWHNFQTFAEWFSRQKNAGRKGFALDKDLRKLGNKQYSSDTCSFVPAKINCLLSDSAAIRGEFPIGVSINIRDGRYQSHIKLDGKGKNLGLFDCPEDAHKAYLSAKVAHVAFMAEKYKEDLHEEVYNNLANWKGWAVVSDWGNKL